MADHRQGCRCAPLIPAWTRRVVRCGQDPPVDGGRWMVARPGRNPAVIWRKSRATETSGSCVEIAQLGQSILVRDSKDAAGPVLALTLAQWRGLLARIRNGELDHG
jgi:uncharacterized protein DUF397